MVKIHDTDFYVDLKRLEFRQVNDPKNAISFRNVQDNGDHTAVVYDPKTRNAFQGTWEELMTRKDVGVIRLPALINLDREGLVAQLNQNALEAHLKRQQTKIVDNGHECQEEPRARRRRKGRGI
jgi:hypothetical protein